MSSQDRKKGIPMKRVLDTKKIFVFGSNLRGMHGAGAARDAMDYYGAAWGVGEGPQGQSYAIPTKDEWLRPAPLDEIKMHVNDFLDYARDHGDEEFFVTKIGCGFAGYSEDQIAPMFAFAPSNCELPDGWRPAYYRESSMTRFVLQSLAILLVAAVSLWWLFR